MSGRPKTKTQRSSLGDRDGFGKIVRHNFSKNSTKNCNLTTPFTRDQIIIDSKSLINSSHLLKKAQKGSCSRSNISTYKNISVHNFIFSTKKVFCWVIMSWELRQDCK